MLFPSKLFYL